MAKKFKISVVLPVYNGMQFLEESVHSIINQEFTDFEFLVCDDCSTDGSYDFLRNIKFENFTLLRNSENLGLFPTLNILVKLAKSPLIHLWSQDDIMLPNCLYETYKFHRQFPDVGFSFSRLQNIDSLGNLLPPPETFPHKTLSSHNHAVSSLLYGSISGNISNVCLVAKKLSEVGYFNSSMKYSGDFDMWCKLSKTSDVGMNGKILVHVRQHSGQLSKNLEASYYKLKENLEIYECFLQTIRPNLRKPIKKVLKWKIYTLYFSQFLVIFKKDKSLAIKYLKHLRKYDYILPLIIRWTIIKFMKLIKKEQYFYQNYLHFSKFE